MAGAVSGRLQDGESADLIPLAESPRDRVGRPGQRGPIVRVSQFSGSRRMISSGFSTASASAAPHQRGIPSASQTAWQEPWWSGWACVSVRAETGRPRT